MSPLVSVIVPAYNAEPFLAEALRSVLDQTHPRLELIVVNDGSTDHTGALARTFATDARVRVIDQENAGVSAARNRGFSESKGAYLAFLDADDVLLPDNLARKLARFEAEPELGLVHADLAVVDAETKQTGEVMSGQEGALLEALLLWQGTCIPTPSSILVRREVVETVGGFDEALSNNADQEFFFRVAHRYRIGRVPAVLGWYRDHGNNMHKNIPRMERDTLLAFRRAEEHQLFRSRDQRNRAFANMYLILAGSWWKDGENKRKGLQFLWRAALTHRSSWKAIWQKLG